MQTMHLFAGAGGGILADLILGHTPLCAVEWDPYCCAVLRERVSDGWFAGMRVHESDVTMFDPSEYTGRVDCISAGFPCQDISVSGSGAGITGARSGLYREILRIAGILRPRFLFLENSPAIVGRGLGRVLGDVAALGYSGRWTVLAASDVGAAHKRERWWGLFERADTDGLRQLQPQGREQNERGWIGNVGAEISNPDKAGLPIREKHNNNERQKNIEEGNASPSRSTRATWWHTEPAVGRVVNGLASRVHRIKALGNGQVPLQAAVAWKILGGP